MPTRPPPAPHTAHQIVNTSERTLRYLALSGMQLPDVCYYPDSGKYGAYFDGGEENRFVARRSSALDYWDGEPVDGTPTVPREGDR